MPAWTVARLEVVGPDPRGGPDSTYFLMSVAVVPFDLDCGVYGCQRAEKRSTPHGCPSRSSGCCHDPLGPAWGWLIPANNGLGYDGATYAGIVRDPDGWILGDRLGKHRVERILPSLTVHALLRPWDAHRDDQAIIHTFHILNLALLVTCAYIWAGIAQRLRLSRSAAWLGFTGLFVTYATLKFPSYYPVLTDISGFALGAALLWCFLNRRVWLILGVGLISAWTWPTVWYSALLLLPFDYPSEGTKRRRAWLAPLVALLLVVGSVSASIYAWICRAECVAGVMIRATVPALRPASLVLLGVWVFLATWPLLKELVAFRFLSNIRWPRVGLAIALYFIVSQVQAGFATPSELGLARTLANISVGGAAKPLGFLVAHVAYFGPMVILAAFLWRRIASVVGQHGLAMALLMTGYVVLATGPESRTFMNIWPFVVAFTAVAVDQLGWGWRRVGWFAVLSLAVSRVWLPLNWWGEYAGDYRLYPEQLYFMSMGPRMTVPSYLIMLSLTLVVAVLTYRLMRIRTSDTQLGPVTQPG